MQAESSGSSPFKHQVALTAGALGVVFGDIGTSPIYTLKECFSPASPHHIAATQALHAERVVESWAAHWQQRVVVVPCGGRQRAQGLAQGLATGRVADRAGRGGVGYRHVAANAISQREPHAARSGAGNGGAS